MLSSAVIFVPAAVATIAIPMSQTLEQLFVAFFVYGFCFGFFETGCNLYTLRLWDESASPFLQALQFMYGVGSLVAPVVARPFLSTYGEFGEQDSDLKAGNQLIFPYGSLAALICFNAISCFCLWVFIPIDGDDTASAIINSEAESENGCKPTQSSATKWKHLTAGLVFLLMHIYFGNEVAFGSFIMTFAVTSDLHSSKATGALLTTTFWATFTAARFVAIVIAHFLGNEMTIAISLLIALASNIVLLAGGEMSEEILFFGVGMMGVAICAVFGCVYAFMNEKKMLSSFVASGITISAVLGEVTFPAIVSIFIESHPISLMWMSFACTLIQILLSAIIFLICRTKLCEQ